MRLPLLAPAVAAVAAAVAIATAPGAPVVADNTMPFTIPRGVVIPVVLTKEIRVGGIGDSQIKKVTTMEVAQDVIVSGHLIAQKGDTVDGNMSAQKNTTVRMFSANTSQELALDVDDVVNFCGDTIHMKYERTLVGGARMGGPFGGHVHDAVFDKGAILKATTDRVQKGVCSQKSSEANAPLPDNILISDEELAAQASPAPSK